MTDQPTTTVVHVHNTNYAAASDPLVIYLVPELVGRPQLRDPATHG